MQSDNAFARTELVAVVYGRYTMRLYIVVWHHQFLGLLILLSSTTPAVVCKLLIAKASNHR